MEVEAQSFLSQVIACEVELSNKSFPYGTVTSGVLTIKGFVRDALWSRDNDLLVKRNGNPDKESIGGYRTEAWLEWKLDALEEGFGIGNVVLVPVLLLSIIGRENNSKPVRGLVLRKLDDLILCALAYFQRGKLGYVMAPILMSLPGRFFVTARSKLLRLFERCTPFNCSQYITHTIILAQINTVFFLNACTLPRAS
jgi:hypothetical protein